MDCLIEALYYYFSIPLLLTLCFGIVFGQHLGKAPKIVRWSTACACERALRGTGDQSRVYASTWKLSRDHL